MKEIKESKNISENDIKETSETDSKETNYSTLDKLKADIFITANQASNMSNKERAEYVDKQAEDIAETISESIDNFLEKLFRRKK